MICHRCSDKIDCVNEMSVNATCNINNILLPQATFVAHTSRPMMSLMAHVCALLSASKALNARHR